MSIKKGSIELIAGSMFSGKTSEIIRRIERYLIANKKVIALKWKGDTRYTDEPYIITHSNLRCECIPCDNGDLKIIYSRIKDYEIICIDEGCFFQDIVSFCEDLANKGHTVIVASLIGNYFREGFNDILNLIPKCETVTWLTAICMNCYKEGAAFTQMIRKDIPRDGKELVGGKNSYIACCRECFYKTQSV
jgi:thymidine kinase